MARILVVGDDAMVLNVFEATLTRLGHEVVAASSGRTGIEAYRRHRPMATILDLQLPDMNGIEVLMEMIRAIDPRAPVMIWTGAGTEALKYHAQQRGVTEFLGKGFWLFELGEALRLAMACMSKDPVRAAEAGSRSS